MSTTKPPWNASDISNSWALIFKVINELKTFERKNSSFLGFNFKVIYKNKTLKRKTLSFLDVIFKGKVIYNKTLEREKLSFLGFNLKKFTKKNY